MDGYDNVQPAAGGGFHVLRPTSGPKLKAPAPPPPTAAPSAAIPPTTPPAGGQKVLLSDAFLTKQLDGFSLSSNKTTTEDTDQSKDSKNEKNNNVLRTTKDNGDDEFVMFV